MFAGLSCLQYYSMHLWEEGEGVGKKGGERKSGEKESVRKPKEIKPRMGMGRE